MKTAILELIKEKKALILINKVDVDEAKIRIKESDVRGWSGKGRFMDFSTERYRYRPFEKKFLKWFMEAGLPGQIPCL